MVLSRSFVGIDDLQIDDPLELIWPQGLGHGSLEYSDARWS